MSAVSMSVTPSSSAASMTARDCSRSHRPPKLFVPRPTTETSGPPSPSIRVRTSRRYPLGSVARADAAAFASPTRRAAELRKRVRKRARVDDGERSRGTRQRNVELAQSGVSPLLHDQRRLDHDDVIELEALRLTGCEDWSGALVECLAVQAPGKG